MQIQKSKAVVFLLILLTIASILWAFLTARHAACDNLSTKNFSSGWEDNGISLSSQGRVWKARKWRKFKGKRRSGPYQGRKRKELSYTCKNWAVITTIFSPTKVCRQIAEMKDWCLVIVADKKTDGNSWTAFTEQFGKNVAYLSPERQRSLNYSITWLLEWNHFGRKNLGYLFAIENGAQFIWDTDDDNELKSGKMLNALIKDAKGNGRISVADGYNHLWNPYPHFEPMRSNSAQKEEVCWPRGFPLEYVKDVSTQGGRGTGFVHPSYVGVYQSLADNDPDVDGVYRLTKVLPFRFMRSDTKLAISPNRYAPFNAQATLWMPTAFWGLLLPTSVHGRVTDIWRSYFTERLMADLGLQVAFTSPIVTQYRNKHNLIADVQSEIPLYTKANELTKWLTKWRGRGSLAKRMEKLAIDLYEIGVLEESDVALYQAWLDDLDAIWYNMPPTSFWPRLRVDVTKENTKSIPRVAVCVSGQLRTLTTSTWSLSHPKNWRPMRARLPNANVTVAQSIQRNLYPKLGNPDVFMYVSTRETSREPSVGDTSVCEPLRSTGGHLHCDVPKEEPLAAWNRGLWNQFLLRRQKIAPQGLLQQLYGMFQCYQAISRHEIATGKEYDWVVRLRPDIYVVDFPNLETLAMDSKEPTVWFADKRSCCCGNEDWFGVAPMRWMRDYFNRYLYLQYTNWGSKHNWIAEYFLQKHLANFGINLRAHSRIKACPVKPRNRRSRSEP